MGVEAVGSLFEVYGKMKRFMISNEDEANEWS